MRAQVYRDARREHRWRLVSKGRIIAESGEGYRRRIDCVRGLRSATGPRAAAAAARVSAAAKAGT